MKMLVINWWAADLEARPRCFIPNVLKLIMLLFVHTHHVQLFVTHPWDSPGKITGVGCHFLLWGIFLTHFSWIGRQIIYQWATWEALNSLCYFSSELFYLTVPNICLILLFMFTFSGRIFRHMQNTYSIFDNFQFK